jgi:uroporphyrinogen-III decarboxylase
MVLNHNVKLVDKFLEIGIEMLYGGDDMGMQKSLPISPADWRRYLRPCFEAIFGRCRDKGIYVYLHSDGHILEIIPDLAGCGVRVINPQIRANTLEGLVKAAKGKVCINLDLDRQMFPFATPKEIKAHIHEVKDALYLPEGGLMLTAECAPDVPLVNIKAICEALEEVGGGPR